MRQPLAAPSAARRPVDELMATNMSTMKQLGFVAILSNYRQVCNLGISVGESEM